MSHDTPADPRITALEHALAAQRTATRRWAAGFLILLACTAAALYRHGQMLADELAARPLIAVLDMDGHLRAERTAHPDGGVSSALATVFGTARTLAENGYMVLNRSAIVATPTAWEVPIPEPGAAPVQPSGGSPGVPQHLPDSAASAPPSPERR